MVYKEERVFQSYVRNLYSYLIVLNSSEWQVWYLLWSEGMQYRIGAIQGAWRPKLGQLWKITFYMFDSVPKRVSNPWKSRLVLRQKRWQKMLTNWQLLDEEYVKGQLLVPRIKISNYNLHMTGWAFGVCSLTHEKLVTSSWIPEHSLFNGEMPKKLSSLDISRRYTAANIRMTTSSAALFQSSLTFPWIKH